MGRKFYFLSILAVLSMLVFGDAHLWAVDDSMAIQGAESEMGEFSREAEQESQTQSFDQSAPDDSGLITDETASQVTTKKTKTVIKETTTTKAPKKVKTPRPQYIK